MILLFLVFQKMTGAVWRSAFVAALFAIHPLRVESVAWIAERKDVLSGVFFMLTLGAYIHYVRKPSGMRYLAVALLFALGLMTKPMLVTLPFVILLLDYWPLGRFTNVSPTESNLKTGITHRWNQTSTATRLILEKIPLIVLSVGSSIATVLAQKPAISSIENLPFLWRINNAFVSYVVYMWQMIWPINLALFYPHPEYRLSFWEVAFAVALLLGMTAAVVALRRKQPYLITGWFWYVGMLVPVIGIMQVGFQARADRYTYLPQIGLYLIATWSIADLSMAWRHRRQILAVAAVIVIAALASVAWIQINPNDMNAQTNLAWVFATSPDASLRDGVKAVELAKEVVERAGHANVIVLRTLAAGYAESGRFTEAIETAQQALQLAVAQGSSALTEDLQLNIANYQRGLPLRDPGAVNRSSAPR